MRNINPTIKGIIFDLDGTLIDSEEGHFLSWVSALERRGTTLTPDEYAQVAGQAGLFVAKALHRKAPIGTLADLLDDKNRFFHEEQKHKIAPIVRTVNFVRELAERKQELGIKLAVASAGEKENILAHLHHFSLIDYFDAIVSGKDDLSDYSDPEGVNKPKPYVYLHAAKLLGFAPHECVAFEDSSPGLSAAVRAGLITFAVPNHYTKNQDFSEANFIIPPTSELDLEDFFQRVATI